MPREMTPDEAARFAAFKAATLGLRAWPLAKIVSGLTPGTDWRGCTKGRLAGAFARDERCKRISIPQLETALAKAPGSVPGLF